MSKPSNRDIERYCFEMFREDYPLPSGTITYKDAPDVITEGVRRIGIEITNFYIEDGSLSESEQSQMKLRDKVVSGAQRAYLAQSGKSFEISFGFEKTNPIRDQKALATKIARLAKGFEGRQSGQVPKVDFKDLPELSFVYLNAREYSDPRWRVMQVYNVPLMSRDRLVQIVRSKEERASKYEKCDSYWLLVVVDFINFAQDQEIRLDDFVKIQTGIFEKVIVYKTLYRHVLEAC